MREDYCDAIVDAKEIIGEFLYDGSQCDIAYAMNEAEDTGSNYLFRELERKYRAIVNMSANCNGSIALKVAFRAVLLLCSFYRGIGGTWQCNLPATKDCMDIWKYAKKTLNRPLRAIVSYDTHWESYLGGLAVKRSKYEQNS
jgi:hypothetical protein